MKTIPRFTCQGAEDLLAVPAVMLGFYPEDSTVLLVIQNSQVQVCARLDSDWMQRCFAYTVTSLHSAVARFPGARTFVLGYARPDDPTGAGLESLLRLAGMLDDIAGIYFTNGSRFWDLDVEDPEADLGTPWNWSASQVAATAVYHGITISGSRESATSGVRAPDADHALLPQARAVLADLPDQVAHLGYLMERDEDLSELEACQLALLLTCEECAAAMLTRLSTETAGHYRARLGAARRTMSGPEAAGVLGVLGVACWLAGEGASTTECLLQLHEMAPAHPLARFLRHVHEHAVPPEWWGDFQ